MSDFHYEKSPAGALAVVIFLLFFWVAAIYGTVAYINRDRVVKNACAGCHIPTVAKVDCPACHFPKVVIFKTLGEYKRGKVAERILKVRQPDLTELTK